MTTQRLVLSVDHEIDAETLTQVNFTLEALVANIARAALTQLRDQALEGRFPPPYLHAVRVRVQMEIEPR